MRRTLLLVVVGALLVGGALAAGVLANGGPVRQGVEGPETIAEAQRKIEALPYTFTFSHPPRDARNALIIATTDEHEKSFRFFLFRGHAPEDIGIPSYHREHLEGGQLGESFVMLESSAGQMRPETITIPPRPYQGNFGITASMEHEYFDIEFAVEDAVCELSTGKPCPAI